MIHARLEDGEGLAAVWIDQFCCTLSQILPNDIPSTFDSYDLFKQTLSASAGRKLIRGSHMTDFKSLLLQHHPNRNLLNMLR